MLSRLRISWARIFSRLRGKHTSLLPLRDIRNLYLAHSPLQMHQVNLIRGGQSAIEYCADRDWVIAHRGVPGPVSDPSPVTNKPSFLQELSVFLRCYSIDTIFLPHSFNLLFFIALASPRVRRISYIDEGQLMHVYLSGQRRRVAASAFPLFRALGWAYVSLPAPLDRISARLMRSRLRQIHERLLYDKQSPALIFATHKDDLVTTHMPQRDYNTHFRCVSMDLRLGCEGLATDLAGAVCVFVNKFDLRDPAPFLHRLRKRQPLRVVIKAHPHISPDDNKLRQFVSQIAKITSDTQIVQVSDRLEVIFELYARGVRTVVLRVSSINLTIDAYRDHFTGLEVISV